jgi:ectoine hydroxylase-related dioxygenase (phytanoyl-CoA dioxygenase family)
VLAKAPGLEAIVTGPLRGMVRPYFDAPPFAVRIVLFDKTPLANWKATWHQDVTIAVTEYREASGWGPWSRKDGGWQVCPPAGVLAGMLTARLHLDPCGPGNGPVRVVPGTHRLGRLSDPEISAAARSAIPVDCLAGVGAVVLLRPLLLHSSAPASDAGHRRVLHVEFAAHSLPDGFIWASTIPPGAG